MAFISNNAIIKKFIKKYESIVFRILNERENNYKLLASEL